MVSSTEQPPATDTGLLEQSAPQGSLQQQFLERSARQRSLKQHSSGQLHRAVSSDKQLGRYSNNGILITEVKVISFSVRFFYNSINEHGHGVLPIASTNGRARMEQNGNGMEIHQWCAVIERQIAELVLRFDGTERNGNVTIFMPPTVHIA